MSEDLFSQVKKWAEERTAASFWIPCKDKTKAGEWQKFLKENGFNGFVTTMGTEISLVLYLNDNKK